MKMVEKKLEKEVMEIKDKGNLKVVADELNDVLFGGEKKLFLTKKRGEEGLVADILEASEELTEDDTLSKETQKIIDLLRSPMKKKEEKNGEKKEAKKDGEKKVKRGEIKGKKNRGEMTILGSRLNSQASSIDEALLSSKKGATIEALQEKTNLSSARIRLHLNFLQKRDKIKTDNNKYVVVV